jgi:type I restriction enzyme M protein
MVQPTKEDTMRPSAGTAGFLVSAGNTYTRNILIGFMKNRLEQQRYVYGVWVWQYHVAYWRYEPTIARDRKPYPYRQRFLSKQRREEQFSLILANPPFKGSLDYDSVESSILKMVKSKKPNYCFRTYVAYDENRR